MNIALELYTGLAFHGILSPSYRTQLFGLAVEAKWGHKPDGFAQMMIAHPAAWRGEAGGVYGHELFISTIARWKMIPHEV